jgi:hypothetical protein
MLVNGMPAKSVLKSKPFFGKIPETEKSLLQLSPWSTFGTAIPSFGLLPVSANKVLGLETSGRRINRFSVQI